MGVLVTLVEDLLLGGRVSVVLHAQGVDLVADAPFDARLRCAQRLLRAGSEGGHVLVDDGVAEVPVLGAAGGQVER